MLCEILYRLVAPISIDWSSPCNIDFAGYAGTRLFDEVYGVLNLNLTGVLNAYHSIILDLHCNCP